VLAQSLNTASDAALLWSHVLAAWLEADSRLVRATSKPEEGEEQEEGEEADMRALCLAESGRWGVEGGAAGAGAVSAILGLVGPTQNTDDPAAQLYAQACDPLTSQSWVLKALKHSGGLLTRHADAAARLLLAFVARQYLERFHDDPDRPELMPVIQAALQGQGGKVGPRLPACMRACAHTRLGSGRVVKMRPGPDMMHHPPTIILSTGVVSLPAV
jgi:hypothetical protein